jgi:hypothetical protein
MVTRNLLIILSLIISLEFVACRAREENPDKLAKEIIELSGSKEQFNLVLDAILKNTSERRANAIKGLVNVNEFCERLIPLYKKHFNISEMQDLIDFYKSDTGRKLILLNPILFKEGSIIGEQYFKEKLAAISYFSNGF